MTPIVKHFWVPVRLTGSAYVRIQAVTAEDAIDMVECHQFNDDDVLEANVEGVEVTGSPIIQEVS